MKKYVTLVATFLLLTGFFILLPKEAAAYRIEDLVNVTVEGDFTVGPGKTEVYLDSGQTADREVEITNRTGRVVDFKITLEDFKGSPAGETPLHLLGAEKGPYSLKDYVEPETTEFTLAHGQRMILPVKVSIPEEMEPGGLYGAVLVSALPSSLKAEGEEGKAGGQIKITARIASLYFVRIKGDVNESGFLRGFKTIDGKKFYTKGPISFELLFENDGNVHINPYGIIEIKNILGKKIEEIKLDPWFVMPGSLRSRKVDFGKEWLFGRYTAKARINRGYNDIIDEKSFVFWVIPWQIIVPVILLIILFAVLFKWFFSKFEIRTKREV